MHNIKERDYMKKTDTTAIDLEYEYAMQHVIYELKEYAKLLAERNHKLRKELM